MLRKLGKKQLLHAVELLEAGKVVALPTETVYGLAGDARNPAAVEKIFSVKKRPSTQALSILIPSTEHMTEWANTIPLYAQQLAEAFWPGPMTLILPKKSNVLDTLTGNSPNVGLRVPDNAMALQILTAFGSGLAAPSANSFGQLSPTTAQHVKEGLGDAVDLILDGGICSLGIESSIIDCTGEQPKLLRQGFLSSDDIEQCTELTLRQDTPPTSKSFDDNLFYLAMAEIKQIISSSDEKECIVVLSRQKPSCREFTLHDSRVPVRLKKSPDHSHATRHWILMPQDEVGFSHCFYEQLHFAKQLLQEHTSGKVLVEMLDGTSFIWRVLDLRLKGCAPRANRR
jgi:L-threonylcarbamoyladenylate synthase